MTTTTDIITTLTEVIQHNIAVWRKVHGPGRARMRVAIRRDIEALRFFKSLA